MKFSFSYLISSCKENNKWVLIGKSHRNNLKNLVLSRIFSREFNPIFEQKLIDKIALHLRRDQDYFNKIFQLNSLFF